MQDEPTFETPDGQPIGEVQSPPEGKGGGRWRWPYIPGILLTTAGALLLAEIEVAIHIIGGGLVLFGLLGLAIGHRVSNWSARQGAHFDIEWFRRRGG